MPVTLKRSTAQVHSMMRLWLKWGLVTVHCVGLFCISTTVSPVIANVSGASSIAWLPGCGACAL